MSPTSYQTAPPRRKIITAWWSRVKLSRAIESAIQLLALAGVYDLFRIDGFMVNLLFENLPVFPDQEVHPARGFIFVNVDSVLASDVSTPIAQQGKVTPIWSAKALLAKGLSMLTPRT